MAKKRFPPLGFFQAEEIDIHAALADKHNAFPKKLSDDGCHPNPDTYLIMEELVLKAIEEAMK